MIIAIHGKAGSGKDTLRLIIQYLIYCNRKPHSRTEALSEYEATQLINELKRNPTLNLDDHSNWHTKRFAGALKRLISEATGISLEDLEKEHVKNSYLPEEWDIHVPRYFARDTPVIETVGDYESTKMTVRNMLQKLGTDAVRAVHPNFWINLLFNKYKKVQDVNTPKGISSMNPWFEGVYPNWIIPDLRFPNEYDAIVQRGGLLIKITRKGNTTNGNDHISEKALDGFEFKYEIENDKNIEHLIEIARNILRLERLIE